MMIGVLVLLYALNAAFEVPASCFIAAWVLTAIGIIYRAIETHANKKDK